MVTTPLSEKKSSTKDVDKKTDALADSLLIENKSSKNNAGKGTNELVDTIFMEKK